MKNITLIAGARPNFMKIAPIIHAIKTLQRQGWDISYQLVHPRTAIILDKFGINRPHLHRIEPLGSLEFNYLEERAKAVLTVSGGNTDETTVMGVPCMTLRDNTERPETITEGTNELLRTDPK